MSMTTPQTRFGCYIGNIDRSVTIDMLKQVFCQCGTIVDCSLNGRDGDPYRFGFIDFATEDDRARALKYNGFTLVGRKLKVGISKGNVNKPEGFASGNPGGISLGYGGDRPRQPYGMRGGHGYNGGGDMDGGSGNGLTAQQQIEARLLLQLIQEGKMDPRQLSPAQQQLLIASLNQGNVSPGNNSPAPSMNPMQQQQMPSSMMGGGHGGYPNSMSGHGNAGQNMMMPQMSSFAPTQHQRSPLPYGGMPMNSMYGHNPSTLPSQQLTSQPQVPYGVTSAAVLSGSAVNQPGRGTPNSAPSAETLRLREKQREQYFEVVRKETEKYIRKAQDKKTRGAAGETEGDRSDSSASDDDEKPSKKAKKEASTPSK